MPDKAPDSAVLVWVEGKTLCYRIRNSHSGRLPIDKFRDGLNVGYEIFLNLLREREKGRGPIGTKFAPVQHDVDKAVAAFGKKITKAKTRPGTAEQRAIAKDVVARLIGTKQ